MSSDVSALISFEEISEVGNMTAAELIAASGKALGSEDWPRVTECLTELRKLLVEPGVLRTVLDSDLRSLLQTAVAYGPSNVATMALYVLTDSLRALSTGDMAKENDALARVLLRLIKLDVMLVATSPDVLVPAFEALRGWCLQGQAHRKSFLEVCPLVFLEELYTRDCPLAVFVPYVEVVASVIRYGKDANGVLPTVLRIFERAVRDQGIGKSCEVVEVVCDAMVNVFEDFKDENVVEEVLESRLASALVRHVVALPSNTSLGACQRNCLTSMMKLLPNMMCSSEEHCGRFIDQGILLALEVALAVGNVEQCRFACMALTNAFAYSPFSIEFALQGTIAQCLLRLREDPDHQDLRKEALRAASNFFSKASSAQIFAMIKMGYVPEIVKVLRSPHAEVISNGVLSLLAVIGATNYTDPLKLPALHQLLTDHEVPRLTSVLQYHKVKEIRLAAMAVNKFMESYLDEEVLRSGTRPKWSGWTSAPSQADLQSVMSLPM